MWVVPGQEQGCGGVGTDAVSLQQFGCVGVDGVGDPLVEVVDLAGEFDDPASRQSQCVCGGCRRRVGLARVEAGASADEFGVAESGHRLAQGRVGTDEDGLELVEGLCP